MPDESAAEEDAAFERRDAAAVTLYKVSDAGGSLQVDTISTKPIRQEMLKSEDCFILDTGTAIYVWVGKQATQTEKTQAMSRAQSVYALNPHSIPNSPLTFSVSQISFRRKSIHRGPRFIVLSKVLKRLHSNNSSPLGAIRACHTHG